jgi:putative MFS transporter
VKGIPISPKTSHRRFWDIALNLGLWYLFVIGGIQMSSMALLLDKIPARRFQRRIMFGCGLGWLFDAFDIGLLSFVLATLSREWNLPPAQIGNIIAANSLGMLVGAAVGGTLADKFGRKNVFVWSLLIYGIGTGLCGFVNSPTQLLWLRLLVGFGLGSELPVVGAYFSEFAPTSVRGKRWMFFEFFWASGFFLGALVAYFIIPEVGWRIAFIIGVLPAFYVVYVRRGLPESIRYLEKMGRITEARQVLLDIAHESGTNVELPSADRSSEERQPAEKPGAFVDLWKGRFLKRTIMLWLMWFGISFAYYGTNSWMPSYLAMRGFSLVRTFGFVSIMFVAQFPGLLLASYLIDRIGRRVTFSVYLVVYMVGCFMFAQSQSSSSVIFYGSLIALANVACFGMLYVVSTELYPTHLRATGDGWANAVGRLGGVIGPIVIGQLLLTIHQTGVFIMFSAVLGVVIIAFLMLGEETSGKTLEEISEPH